MSQANWPNLTIIQLGKEEPEYLGSNKISAEGCLHMKKAHWPDLRSIGLCKKISTIQLGTKQVLKDAST